MQSLSGSRKAGGNERWAKQEWASGNGFTSGFSSKVKAPGFHSGITGARAALPQNCPHGKSRFSHNEKQEILGNETSNQFLCILSQQFNEKVCTKETILTLTRKFLPTDSKQIRPTHRRRQPRQTAAPEFRSSARRSDYRQLPHPEPPQVLRQELL